MVAAFDDLAVLQDDDAVGAADGGQSVGDDQTGAAFQQLYQRLLDEHLGVGVDAGRRFVEDKDLCIRDQCACKTDQLALAEREIATALPDGYDTELEQRGGNLSLGQRQLISFARALVADAKILVLDEATASIDSYTEMLIQKALVTLLEGRTGLVIAHRLATIRGADRIIVLQNGEIVESGNHDQLMAAKGLYARLYNMNYVSFDDIAEEDTAAPAGKAT